jgi:uncharacterized membrane protein YedE/YeeE
MMTSLTKERGPALAQAAIVLALWGALALYILLNFGRRTAVLFVIALLLGIALKHAAFGFTTQWRRFLVAGDGSGVRAQMLMLAAASGLMLPVLASGSILGHGVTGAVAPAGVSVAVGAFMFGVAMQIANGCASGTLYSLGAGSTRMLVSLLFFMLGSLWGSADLPWWFSTPYIGSVSLLSTLGLWKALALQWVLFAIIAGASLWLEKARGYNRPADKAQGFSLRRVLRGPWGWVAGGLVLAVLNFATLAAAGHPWTISFGYTLWGAKIAQGLGFDLSHVAFWSWPYPARALAGSWLAEDTSVMNLGIILGAALAAALAGGIGPLRRISWRATLGAALGGLMMGYGARIAFGCNVGAYFSGVATGSLHGWEWLIAGLAGSWVGVRLRPFFDLPNP